MSQKTAQEIRPSVFRLHFDTHTHSHVHMLNGRKWRMLDRRKKIALLHKISKKLQQKYTFLPHQMNPAAPHLRCISNR